MTSVLPQMDEALISAALSVTELGAWLLASCGLPLLCVPLDAARAQVRCAAVPVGLALGADVALGRTLASERKNQPLLKRLVEAADALSSDLATRWPPYALPPRVGLITDGTGLAFSPDDPWPLSAGWLQRQRAGAGSLVELVPFDMAGAWMCAMGDDLPL